MDVSTHTSSHRLHQRSAAACCWTAAVPCPHHHLQMHCTCTSDQHTQQNQWHIKSMFRRGLVPMPGHLIECEHQAHNGLGAAALATPEAVLTATSHCQLTEFYIAASTMRHTVRACWKPTTTSNMPTRAVFQPVTWQPVTWASRGGISPESGVSAHCQFTLRAGGQPHLCTTDHTRCRRL